MRVVLPLGADPDVRAVVLRWRQLHPLVAADREPLDQRIVQSHFEQVFGAQPFDVVVGRPLQQQLDLAVRRMIDQLADFCGAARARLASALLGGDSQGRGTSGAMTTSVGPGMGNSKVPPPSGTVNL